MNLDEAARFLRVTTRALERWIRQGFLTEACMSGSMFVPEALEAWARERGVLPQEGPGSVLAPVGDIFSQAVECGAVTSIPGPQTARTAIGLAVAALEQLSEEQREEILTRTLVRERLMSTALGSGVAAPHPRHAIEGLISDQAMSVLYVVEPVDWAAPDGALVHTVLLLISPNMQLQLQLLSRVGTALRSPGFPEFLATRPDKAALLERLAEIHGAG